MSSIDVTSDSFVKDWYGQDPLSFILNIIAYPFTVPPDTGLLQQIKIGKIDVVDENGLNILAYTTKKSFTMSAGEIFIEPKYGNFLDYEPYSIYTLYIPFYGSYTLDSKIFVGHRVKVDLIIDVFTNTCQINIYMDDFIYESIQTQYGYKIPITSYSYGEYASQKYQIQAQKNSLTAEITLNFLISAATMVITQGKSGLKDVTKALFLLNTVSSGAKYGYEQVKLDTEMKMLPLKPVTSDSSGSVSSDSLIRLIVTERLNYITNSYVKYNGSNTNFFTSLNTLTGLTVISSLYIQDKSYMTDEELNMLTNILQGGVFLP